MFYFEFTKYDLLENQIFNFRLSFFVILEYLSGH